MIHRRTPANARAALHLLPLLAVVVQVSCGGGHAPSGSRDSEGGAATDVDHSSPQAVYEDWREAMHEADGRRLYETLSPDGRQRMLRIGVGLVLMGAGQGGLEDEAKSLLQKHGIDLMEVARETAARTEEGGAIVDSILQRVRDKPALLDDVIDYFVRYDPTDEGKPFREPRYGPLQDLAIEGDSARGSLTARLANQPLRKPDELRPGNPRPVVLDFKRIDGRWYVASGSPRDKHGPAADEPPSTDQPQRRRPSVNDEAP
ncbi:MAG: hypothetical protein KY476_04100 [Planctomycetes bacterium]|nr:hypothetical protein [Planctomycetota bacterium]